MARPSTSYVAPAKAEMPLEPGERITEPIRRFMSRQASGGIVLVVATVIALVWANSPFYHSYERVFHETYTKLSAGDLHHGEGHGHGHAGSEDDAKDEPNTPHETDHPPGHVLGDAPADEHANAHETAEGDHSGDEDHAAGAHPVAGEPHWELEFSVGHLINDALMAIFFLFVGLEIKRELLVGELASLRRAALPIAGAIGGMAAPAIIYVALNLGEGGATRGWGIPMATDIAFAIGIMALLGSKAPLGLRVFLTSLAIVDDLGALLVIAIFYTEKLDFGAMGIAGLVLLAMIGFNLLRFRALMPYLIASVFLWYFVYLSGVHATIAGVLAAATVPVTARVNVPKFLRSSRAALDDFEHAGHAGNDLVRNSRRQSAVSVLSENCRDVQPPLIVMEHGLANWVAFIIMPIFALANAGLRVTPESLGAVSWPVLLGVGLGLFIGKPIGVVAASWIAVKLGIAALPRGVTWMHMAGAGCLAGIGFTMALFIANLAFRGDPSTLDTAKLGILIASALSGCAGVALLLNANNYETDTHEPRAG